MTQAEIQAHAEAAKEKGHTPNDVCPWSFYTPQGLHWMACYLCAGLVFTLNDS